MSTHRVIGILAGLLVAAPLAAQVVTGPDTTTARRDSVLVPAPDQARAVDTELRIALFELGADRQLGALSRLEWLRASPGALTGLTSDDATRRREDLAFLLTQTYYRLGMVSRFRTAAQEMLATRYGPIVRAQLMIDAYRRGDNARAVELATGAAAAGDGGLAPLVAGLAHYRSGNWLAARASFAQASQGGGPYAPYARYMDALATLQGDTTQAAAALAALQQLSGTAAADFADQVRLTAASLAYHSGQFDQAASLAEGVSQTSGLAADALITRAWSLYKARRNDAASTAFATFANRYPQLPQRDEARLMVGQLMMEAGRIDDAERYFQAVADTITTEARAMQAGTTAAVAEAARALVTARSAGLLFVSDPTVGKSIALADAAGADDAVMQAALSGSPPSPAAIAPAPDLVTMGDIEARLDALGPPLTGNTRRAMYAQLPGGPSSAAYALRSDALRIADLELAMARYRLQESLDAQNARIALLGQMQQYLTTSGAVVDQALAQVQTVQDSLGRLAGMLDATRSRIRGLVQSNIEGTRTLAAENAARIDSASRALAASTRPADQEILRIEASTAAAYGQLANTIERGIDALVARHPVLARNDSVRRNLDRVRQLAAETRRDMDATTSLVGTELDRLRANESPRTRQLRSAVASAEAQRTSAESQLLALVDAELRARSDRVLGLMRRDAEAAEYGSASASFFRAIEGDRPATGSSSGTPGGSGGTGIGSTDSGGALQSSDRTSTSPR